MIRVVDIFAGPGGLSEGLASVIDDRGQPAFDLRLSIEKEAHAFETLRLRTFFRQFAAGAPDDYYRCLRGEIAPTDLHDRHPSEAREANSRTWHTELGSKGAPLRTVRNRIETATGGAGNWVLIGGPPCQAYSIAGRSRNRSKPGYDPNKDGRQRLYVEYLQILRDHWPAAFVMENVKGLLSATLENERIFHRILQDLRDPTTALKREGRSALRGRAHHYQRIGLRTYFKPPGDVCQYLCDFGDKWQHLVELKDIVELPEIFGCRLLDGARGWAESPGS